ncbi:TniQ family protein [Cereibacter ovatus]|nr:TniQ family protein [Cereibacter ovatus]
MSTAQLLRPLPVHRETFHSFVSRLAATNGVSAADFCVDMGFSLKRAIDLDQHALERIGELGGLPLDVLADMLSWTGERVGNVRMRFRNEIFVSRALRNPVVRGCPVCLREDAAAHDGAPIEAMAMRGDWQLREVSVCLLHRHPLVPTWDAALVTERFDIGSRLAEIEERILSCEAEQARVELSPYDVWLDGRLEDARDGTWLAGHSLYAATAFIRLLGTEMLRLGIHEMPESCDPLRMAQAAGFDVVRRGEPAIRETLADLAALAGGASDTPRKAFGNLFAKLDRDYSAEAAFEPFRAIVRGVILDTWPLAAGEMLFGEPLPERRLHSLRTAASETGVTAALLGQFLTETGALQPKDDRPDNRKTFDARRYADILGEIPTLVGPLEMQKAMGATRNELKSLEEDGILMPRTRIPAIKSPWRTADGTDLVDELNAKAVAVSAEDDAWESLQWSQRRTGVRVGALIAAIREARLEVGRRAGTDGYSGLVVRKTAVDSLAEPPSRMADEGLLPAAAFGRSVGIRDGGKFLAFLAAGHTPARVVRNPKTGVLRPYMTDADIAAFHLRFTTTTTLEVELGEHRNTILARLTSNGIAPYRPDGQDYGPIYLRDDIKRALPRLRQNPSSALPP